ncbi:129aa long hypothetical protein [Pyrococcus horikoshii OT3]|uniref:Uncharacterized protein n=1 Tax=Pyrococcus horikoshii (strain ATCC 700860 / DSM 12428 / JCM 9974 / NBRC 100139 / OT-3) TaxID=70601 RepID=O58912_PYRHO|nr:129aa long hypothetical protein [Pyrococcus horikoshii OT3]
MDLEIKYIAKEPSFLLTALIAIFLKYLNGSSVPIFLLNRTFFTTAFIPSYKAAPATPVTMDKKILSRISGGIARNLTAISLGITSLYTSSYTLSLINSIYETFSSLGARSSIVIPSKFSKLLQTLFLIP